MFVFFSLRVPAKKRSVFISKALKPVRQGVPEFQVFQSFYEPLSSQLPLVSERFGFNWV
jgi:hypothetical protein